ncbi:hypothetical protein LCGC14_0875570 [marine sediment metagenome]|uniref:Uncharacterized protein n=1 Tax=marine sediment metagenome TaxID=412755 RepID=A0A0F9SAG0_9ZZZZ
MNMLNLVWMVPVALWLLAVVAGTLYTYGWLLRRHWGPILLYVALVAAGVLLFRP